MDNKDRQVKQNQTTDPIEQFVGQVLDAKKIPGTDDPEIRQQLVNDLKTRLMAQIDRAMLSALSEQQLDELNKMLDNPNIQESDIQEFYRRSGIDGRQIAFNTMMRFREYYLGNSANNTASLRVAN